MVFEPVTTSSTSATAVVTVSPRAISTVEAADAVVLCEAALVTVIVSVCAVEAASVFAP